MSTDARMSQDPRRLFLFMILSFAVILGTNLLLDRLGLLPKPAPPDAKAVKAIEKPNGAAVEDAPPQGEPRPAPASADAPKTIPPIDPSLLVLGSAEPKASGIEITLDARGAGVSRIRSADFNAEYPGNKRVERPLPLLRGTSRRPLPFAIDLLIDRDGTVGTEGDLDRRIWEPLVGGRTWSELTNEERESASPVTRADGIQSIAFRTIAAGGENEAPVQITKTYRMADGASTFDVLLDFQLLGEGSVPRTLSYRLYGPTGLPIEGEWYTSTFRNAFLGKQQGGSVGVETHSAYEVVSADPREYSNTQLPLAFAGVENQYFTVLLKPIGPGRIDAATALTAVNGDEAGVEAKKADLSVEVDSAPFELAPGKPLEQRFQVYAGPKTAEGLAPLGAEELATYRIVGRIPIIGFITDIFFFFVNPPATFLSNNFTNPLLGYIYNATKTVAGWFGGTRGSYGVAIILLTVVVRLLMFPISRKQAISAKRMQDLQPHMLALREKYKDEPEKLQRETFGLYRKFGVNPFAGCLPVFIQIPIFMSLWRTLNISVALRQAPFLWMDNLAAPDMLFGFGGKLPVFGPYFNLLPFAVIGLMLLQTKLFAPPAASPEQEQQQKIMKYMMIFMGIMFYFVPSGLSIYFITSSLWSIGERLLLPKLTKSVKLPAPGEEPEAVPGAKDGGGKPTAGGGWLARKLEALMAEADKERTHRRELASEEAASRGSATKSARNDEIAANASRRRPDPGRSRPNGKRR